MKVYHTCRVKLGQRAILLDFNIMSQTPLVLFIIKIKEWKVKFETALFKIDK